MRIVPAVEAELRREIRDARARDPLIGVAALEQHLEKKFNRGFSYRYVAKLVDKVGRQALMEADRMQIEERLARTRESYRVIRDRLMKIVCWKAGDDGRRPWASEVTEAGKAIVAMDLAILKAEIDNGLYKKPDEMLVQQFHYEPLDGEVRTIVIQSWRNFGVLSPEIIERMVPALPAHANNTGATS